MNLLPFEKIIYQSKLTQTEITQRLQQETVPLQYIRISFFKKPSGKKFEGKVLENSFNIQRIIYYRNSFLPVISGKVEERTFRQHYKARNATEYLCKGISHFFSSHCFNRILLRKKLFSRK